MWDNTDWDDPAFQQNIKQLGITVLNKDTQPPEAFIGDAIFDHLGNMEFNAPEMNGNLLVLGGLNANLREPPSLGPSTSTSYPMLRSTGTALTSTMGAPVISSTWLIIKARLPWAENASSAQMPRS